MRTDNACMYHDSLAECECMLPPAQVNLGGASGAAAASTSGAGDAAPAQPAGPVSLSGAAALAAAAKAPKKAALPPWMLRPGVSAPAASGAAAAAPGAPAGPSGGEAADGGRKRSWAEAGEDPEEAEKQSQKQALEQAYYRQYMAALAAAQQKQQAAQQPLEVGGLLGLCSVAVCMHGWQSDRKTRGTSLPPHSSSLCCIVWRLPAKCYWLLVFPLALMPGCCMLHWCKFQPCMHVCFVLNVS